MLAVSVAGAVVLAPVAGSTSDCATTPGSLRTPSRAASCPVSFNTSTDVPKAIPDQGSVTSVVDVRPFAPVGNVQVFGLSITHSRISDLRISLTSPAGTTVVLVDQVCNTIPASADFPDIHLRDLASQPIGSTCPPGQNEEYRPSNPLSAFDGEDPEGRWTLTVSDVQLLETGTLDDWTLIVYPECTTGVEIASFTVTRAKKGALLRWRSASESGIAGYHVYRGRERLNRALIRPRGAGHVYSVRDRPGRAGQGGYWLQVVRHDGTRSRHAATRVR